MRQASNTKFAFDRGLMIIGILLLMFFLAAVASFIYVERQATYDKEYISLSGEERVLSQSIVKNAVESASATNVAAAES